MSSPHPFPRPRLLSSQTSCPVESPSRPQNRKRTVSLISLSSVRSGITLFPKAQPALCSAHTRTQSAYGSFILTPSARPNLDHIWSSFNTPSPTLGRLPRPRRSLSRTPSRWPEEDDSPLSSGTSSPTIPSFSRTASPPPLLSPSLTSSSTLHTLAEHKPPHLWKQSTEIDPILAKLERKSKLLRKKVYCASCKKAGSDYPKCGRCDAMWCSRECRMLGGKRHVCASVTHST